MFGLGFIYSMILQAKIRESGLQLAVRTEDPARGAHGAQMAKVGFQDRDFTNNSHIFVE